MIALQRGANLAGTGKTRGGEIAEKITEGGVKKPLNPFAGMCSQQSVAKGENLGQSLLCFHFALSQTPN